MDESNTPAMPSGGRGRGRGGGIAVLPAGMWESLNGSGDTNKREEDNYSKYDEKSEQYADSVSPREDRSRDDYYDRNEMGNSKSKGLEKDVKGKDWDCPSCTNLNWSWRNTCNKCGTARPNVLASENEQRDGIGGGFNERQDRASAAAVEIDDEGFDDFGRRVKKLKRADRQAKEEAALKRLNEKYKHLIPSELETIITQKHEDVPTSTTVAASDTKDDNRQISGGNTRDRSRSRDRNSNYRSSNNNNNSSRDDYRRNDDRDRGDRRNDNYNSSNKYDNNRRDNNNRRDDSRDRYNSRDSYSRRDDYRSGR